MRTRFARFRHDPSIRFLGVCAGLGGLMAGAAALVASATTPPPAVAEAAATVPPELTCPDADGDTGVLRSCLDSIVVRVVTPFGHGSGVVLNTGEIVTNAHVVDGDRAVRVEFVDGRVVDDVAVIGMDVLDDIALLEPIDDLDRGVELVATAREPGQAESTVFLVGFPGDNVADAPQLTITEGVLSRLRHSERFDQTVLQSDATIFDGQSGGALIDRSGQLLGISGSGIGPDVSFSLSTFDVIEAIDRIRGGESLPVALLPDAGDLDTGAMSFELSGGDDSTRLIWIPAGDEARTIGLEIDEGNRVRFSAWTSHTQIAVNRAWSNWERRYYGDPADLGGDDDGSDELSEWYELESPWPEPDIATPEDGRYEIEQPAATDLWVEFGSAQRQEITIDVDVPRLLIDDAATGEAIAIDETIMGTVDALSRRTTHEIELDADDEISIALHTPGATADIRLLTPDPDVDAGYPGLWYSDLGAMGWQDYEVTQSYTIRREGTFLIEISSPYPTAYELSVAGTG